MYDTIIRRHQRVLAALALALIAAAAWAVAAYRVAAGASEVHHGNAVVPLLTSNRTDLRVCVDSKVAEVGNDELKLAIEAGLLKLKLHPDYVPSGLATVPTQVDLGCPGPARATMTDFDHMLGTAPGASLVVTEPSQYRVFVFVVPKEKVSLPDGSVIWRAQQEKYCHDGFCPEVSTALYLTPGDLSLPDRLGMLLTDTVGLEVPELRPDRSHPGDL